MTGLARYDASDLAAWSWSGLTTAFDDREIAGRPMYNAGPHLVGSLRSPVIELDPFDEVIPSWTAITPPGTWLEVRLRVAFIQRWTRWYSLGVWAERDDPVARHSVPGQRDSDGAVATDVLHVALSTQTVQVEVSLFTLAAEVLPMLTSLTLATSSSVAMPSVAAHPETWGRVLDVPARSQMVYRDGGDAWCSPTSVAMVLGYFGIAADVPAAAAGTFDWAYDGCGNWPFNTAYAARHGLDAFVARWPSLGEVERAVAQGIPIVASYAWDEGELSGSPLTRADGHLGVIVGFDDTGDPVVNDPAGPDDAGVRRVYRRAEFERQWLIRSRGTVYVISRTPEPTRIGSRRPAVPPVR